MKALLYKQFKLVAHPMTLAFIACGSMVLIPNYPYSVNFFYVTLGLFFMFLNVREQRDADFSALLPIRKRDTVKSAVLYTVIIEVLSVAVTALFVVLAQTIAPGRDNLAGLDANAAILAAGFLLFAMFNGIFLPAFYRTGYKVGLSYLKANIGIVIIVALDVVMPHVVTWLDGYDSRQYILLAVSAAIYGLVTLLSYKKAAALYEKVDL